MSLHDFYIANVHVMVTEHNERVYGKPAVMCWKTIQSYDAESFRLSGQIVEHCRDNKLRTFPLSLLTQIQT